MKIVDIETIMLRLPTIRLIGDGCQTIMIVKVHTDEGITGLGEVHTNPLVSKAIIDSPDCAFVARGLRSILMGENPLDVARLWDKMYRYTTTFGRHGAVVHAISAIDVALWDILGKALNVPIYRLLGGARVDAVDCYASDLAPATPEESSDLAAKHLAAGYRAMKFGWGQLGQNIRKDIAVMESVRQTVGPDVQIMLDMGMPVPLESAIELGHALRGVGAYFLEEPLAPEDFEGFARLVAASPTPIATGEKLDTLRPFMDLIDRGTLRIIQPDVTRVGGITEMLRIAAYADAKSVRVIPHCWSCDILVAATLHVIATMRNTPYLEFNVIEQPIRRNVIASPFKPVGGRLGVPTGPGLGVELDEDTMKRFRWEG